MNTNMTVLVIKHIWILFIWTKVALALEGLIHSDFYLKTVALAFLKVLKIKNEKIKSDV